MYGAGERQKKPYNPNSFTAVDSGLAFIIILALFFGLEQAFSAVISAIGRDNIDYYLASIISAVISQGAIIGVALIFSKVRNVSLLGGGGFKAEFDWLNILFGLLLILGIFFVFSGAHFDFVDDAYRLVYKMSYDEYAKRLQERISGNIGFGFIYAYILVPLLPCICEEALFRGVIMKGLRNFGDFTAVILTSVFFCFMHGNFGQVVLQFFGGLAITAVVMVTKNYVIGCAMHFANNLFTTLITVFNAVLNEYAQGMELVLEAAQIICGTVFLVVAAVYFARVYLATYKRKLTGKREKASGKDIENLALITNGKDKMPSRENCLFTLRTELPADLYEVGANYYFYDGEKIVKINEKNNGKLSKVLLFTGLIISVAMIFLSLT